MDISRPAHVALSAQQCRTLGILSVIGMWASLSVQPVPAREPGEKREEDGDGRI